MLGKLLKYEMKSQGKSLFLFWMAILGLGLLVRIFSLLEEAVPIFQYLIPISIFTFVLAIVLSLVYCFFLAIKNYYKKVLREEGYLTNTLPVKKSSIISSFLITDVVALIVTVAFSFLGCLIALGSGSEEIRSMWEAFSISIEQEFNMSIETVRCILAGAMLLGYINTISLFYAAMTVGHSFSQNKIASSIGVGVAFYMAFQFLNVIEMIVIFLKNEMDFTNALVTNEVPYELIGTIVGEALIVVAISLITTYTFTNYFLNRKLNLE